MERFTFEEIKNFTVGTIFYSQNKRYHVDSDPTYYNSSVFYGDFSEKVEWTGLCETVGDDFNQQHKFVIQNSNKEGELADETLIFKTLGV